MISSRFYDRAAVFMLETSSRATPVLRTAIVFAACAFILSCSLQAETNPCPDETEPYVEYRLFFGLGDGENPQAVSQEQWNEFLTDVVTPEFPDGLTVLDARGQYSDSSGTVVGENTKLLILLVVRNDGSTGSVDRIIEDYKKKFDQTSVLRVVETSCASF